MRVNPFFAASMVAIALLSVPFSTVIAADAVTEKTSENETAGDETHRLVIQVNKREEDFQDHVLANIVNLQKHYGMDNIEMEVVAYWPRHLVSHRKKCVSQAGRKLDDAKRHLHCLRQHPRHRGRKQRHTPHTH